MKNLDLASRQAYISPRSRRFREALHASDRAAPAFTVNWFHAGRVSGHESIDQINSSPLWRSYFVLGRYWRWFVLWLPAYDGLGGAKLDDYNVVADGRI